LKLYTEDSMTDDRGGGPVANGTQDFRKGQPYEAGLSFTYVRISAPGVEQPAFLPRFFSSLSFLFYLIKKA
jgi:hypothetical protein